MTATTDTVASSGWRLAVGVAVWRDGRVLLGLRTGSVAAGEWGFPGGEVDALEHPLTAASREVLEETGLTLTDVRLLGYTSLDTYGPGREFVGVYAEGSCGRSSDPIVMEPHRCVRWDWFDPATPPAPLMDATVDCLRMLAARNQT